MYLDGHREILAEVLSTRLPVGFLSTGWPGSLKKKSLEKALQRGLAYPDLPCGRVDKPRAGGPPDVHLRRPLLCGVISMIHLMSPRRHQYSELFQSHLGALAYVHAMAPAHRTPTAVVARSIVSHALSLGLLFWRCFDPEFTHKEEIPKNAGFWLGILLHTLTDSYADAHAIRLAGAPLVRAPPPDEEQERVMRHSALLYDLAGRTLDAPLKKKELATEIEKVRRIKNRGVMHLAQQHQTYLLFVMHRQTDRAVDLYLRGRGPANPSVDSRRHPRFKSSRQVTGSGTAARLPKGRASPQVLRQFDIRAFSYYPTQPQPLYHALRDRLALVRDRPAMWNRMLGECAELFVIFREGAVHAASCQPGETASIRAKQRFLKRLGNFLTSGPLRLAPGAAARPPMNYSTDGTVEKRKRSDSYNYNSIVESIGLRALVG